ncbi:Rieske 2Fe-2S domain-containing protein [Streptomyces spongiae]|uniref:Rieske 2Fe-2S domain-containing protein n=1 Tax=Streptomyces spongiae TaxID=565072 RepID=A0A5N8XAL6_9ACTN|nr:Rieske 2Fe-2S domain-containing protein [Streptomyces spongiae]MPY56541.1 Rieske 2Fe-2S domain-containing protein [Streptomyces spongiae]
MIHDQQAAVDVGTAYGFTPGSPLEQIARVGPGTPMGEVLRRYWQPVALTDKVTQTPQRVRVLGEDLLLFRDGTGRPGLLYPRCCHRGASLYYGGVEENGIRCCYHGWVFDVEGRCLEQPCEPELGLHRDRVRQPWYPVTERYGLVWAYMGPPERKPVLPRYDVFEELGPGQAVHADDSGFSGGGPAELDFNWVSHWENVMDPFHVPILHARFSGNQFVPEMAIMPEVSFSYLDHGIRSESTRTLPDGRTLRRVTEAVFPNLRVVADPRLSLGACDVLGWVVPVDDENFKIFTLFRSADPDRLSQMRTAFGGKRWAELNDEEHRRMPGDYEAQSSQGRISLHTDDHLTTTDQGVTMLRRMMARVARQVADGGDPPGLVFDEKDELVCVRGGNYIEPLTDDSAEATP